MLSKDLIRMVLAICILLTTGLIITVTHGQVIQQAQADPQKAILEQVQNDTSPTGEIPMEQPATEMLEHSSDQKSETVEEASIKKGKELFETRCNSCHTTPRATSHTMAEWPENLSRMAPRSFLRDSEVKLILQYLKQELKPANSDETEWDS